MQSLEEGKPREGDGKSQYATAAPNLRFGYAADGSEEEEGAQIEIQTRHACHK